MSSPFEIKHKILTSNTNEGSWIVKLTHGANMFVCSKLFGIGENTIALLLQKVVKIVNIVFKGFIRRSKEREMEVVTIEFKQWCELPSMQGVINGTHVHISKPKISFAKKYNYFKTSRYSSTAPSSCE
jgi:hypothetical protein